MFYVRLFPVPLGLEGLADSGGDVGDRAAWCRGRGSAEAESFLFPK